MNKALLLSMFLVIPCVEALANSQVYQYRDKDGTTILSAKPSKHPDLTLVKVTKSGTDVAKASSSSENITSSKMVNSLLSENYKDLVIEPETEQHLEYLKQGQKVQLFDVVTGDAQASYDDFLEKGYKAIGLSTFRAKNLSNDDVRNQAKEVRATAASIMKIQVEQFHVSVGVGEQSRSRQNQLNEMYEYGIVFYVKNNALALPYNIGVEAQIIPVDKRSAYQRNTGAYIQAVLQGSKAYNANILKGDVILAINDHQVLTPDDFSRIMKESVSTKSKTLNLKVLRIVNSDLKEALISFNLE